MIWPEKADPGSEPVFYLAGEADHRQEFMGK
jgi:hypothetical protein